MMCASQMKKVEMKGEDDMVAMRRGEERDAEGIRAMLVHERMSPLDVDPSRFLVAVDAQDALVGCAQLRSLGTAPRRVLELASVVVAEKMRGKGIGTALISELLQRDDCQVTTNASTFGRTSVPSPSSSSSQDIDFVLLTLKRTCSFYEQLGFEIVSPAHTLDSKFPIAFLAEFALGTVVARIVAGDALVLMRQQRQHR